MFFTNEWVNVCQFFITKYLVIHKYLRVWPLMFEYVFFRIWLVQQKQHFRFLLWLGSTTLKPHRRLHCTFSSLHVNLHSMISSASIKQPAAHTLVWTQSILAKPRRRSTEIGSLLLMSLFSLVIWILQASMFDFHSLCLPSAQSNICSSEISG